MAANLPISFPPSETPTHHPSSKRLPTLINPKSTTISSVPSFFNPRIHHIHHYEQIGFSTHSYRITTRGGFINEEEEEEEDDEDIWRFDEAVSLFNKREYYRCHDVLEALWNRSQEPARTLVHAILQVAVGFHHLFNQNHRGAMMELGEGLCKLRKLNFESGPFHRFEKGISAVLEFIYQTQLEQAACTEESCIAMDGSEKSYRLLGGYAAGQRIYHLEIDNRWNAYIVFCPDRYSGTVTEPPSIKIPVLEASEQHMIELEYH